MFQPRRLRARKPACVQTRQRNPSSFGSNVQPRPSEMGPERVSIGSGSRSTTREAQTTAVNYSHRPPASGETTLAEATQVSLVGSGYRGLACGVMKARVGTGRLTGPVRSLVVSRLAALGRGRMEENVR